MRFPVKTTVALVVLAGAGVAAYLYVPPYLKTLRQVHYREAEVTKGSITAVVNSTGTVNPVLSISVGSFVSGPIEKLYVDFNDIVKKDQILAEIDPRLYKAAVDQATATLAVQKAQLNNAKALLQKAVNDEARALALRQENKTFISDTDLDQYKFNRISLDAQVDVAKANVNQAKASLDTALANLGYTKIKSPVDGVVINRKIDPGQTLAAQFQTPELFIVAPDLKKMYITASVDEGDIGQIRQSQIQGLPVRFTVDSYPDDLFEGTIFQIRQSSTTTQNVVTYPVVVAAENPELTLKPGESAGKNPDRKLMPGMTANLTFQIKEVKDVLRLPNAALRFFPRPEQVRPEDRKILEGIQPETKDSNDSAQATLSAREKAELRRKRNKRYVWVVEGDQLRAVPVVIGLSDSQNTQVISGELKEGQKVVTTVQTGP